MKSLFSFASFVLLLSFSSCKTETAENNTTSEAKVEGSVSDKEATGNPNEVITPTGPTTTMTLDKMDYKFEKVKEGAIVETSFKITNTGKEPLVIVSCKGSCGCTTPKCPTTPIAPGQTAEVPVKFDTHGKPGNQSKDVIITANTVPAQTKFRIHGEVERTKKDGE
jgi:hypothetical protein